MTVVFQLPASRSSPEDVFAVGSSPLAEACFSLRVLANPSRFRAHSEWVRVCRRLLPAELRRELRELTPLLSHALPGFLTATTPASSSYADELARVAKVRPTEARAELLSVLDTWTALREQRKVGAAVDADDLRRQLSEQPRATMHRLVELLERYWHTAFCSEWNRLRPLLRAETTVAAARLQRGFGPAPRPGIHLGDDCLTVRRACTHIEQVTVAERQITLSPSAFLWPRVSVESSPSWPLAVFYPLPRREQGGSANSAADELLPSLRALADSTRLAIIRLIVEHPRSTQELAELVALSQAAVSQHLRLLHAAGLVAAKREGHYVLYSVEPRSLRRVANALAALSRDDANGR